MIRGGIYVRGKKTENQTWLQANQTRDDWTNVIDEAPRRSALTAFLMAIIPVDSDSIFQIQIQIQIQVQIQIQILIQIQTQFQIQIKLQFQIQI